MIQINDVITTQSLHFFDQLACLYKLDKNNSENIYIIPVIMFNNKKYSLYSKESIEKLKTNNHEVILIKTCTSKRDIIQTFLNEKNIKNDNIYITIKCFKIFFSIINSQQDLMLLLSFFSLKNSIDQLHQLRKICKLDTPLLNYCENKKFSFKQLKQLTFIDKEIIKIYSKELYKFNFSARNFEEIINMSNDLLKRKHFSITQLIQLIKTIQSKTSHDQQMKTTQLKKSLFELSHPTLTKKNNQILSSIKELKISKKININWDKSLENKGINISMNASSIKDIQELIDNLKLNQKNLTNIINQT